MQGLCNAVSDVLPRAEHRLCARHVYANWSKTWRGNELKKKFFTCAWSSFEEEFKDNLKALEKLSQGAARAALTYNVKTWVRAYFTARCKSWIVDNNISESFNAWIDEYRYLPVIRMFDGIRIKMMEKWAESGNNVKNWKSEYSPKCLDMFEANRFLAMKCRVFFNGDEGYEVCENQDKHTVFLGRKMCTCRAWDLTGIPCQHAICAMNHAKIDPKTEISHYYHKDTYLASYRTKFQPVRGKKFWDTQAFLPMQPPSLAALPGRPPKKRVRTEEASRRTKKAISSSSLNQMHGTERLTRKNKSHKCSVCNKEGHNKSTCKESPAASRPRNQRKKISPRRSATPSQPSQEPPPPSQSTPRQSQRNNCVYKSRAHCGFGIRVDDQSGRIIYNPGLRSEQVIQEGTTPNYMRNYVDQQKKFPIPNEREWRRSKGVRSSAPEGSRVIGFNPQPLAVAEPTNLPVQLPSLQWRGNPCITTSQLLAKRQTMISNTKQK